MNWSGSLRLFAAIISLVLLVRPDGWGGSPTLSVDFKAGSYLAAPLGSFTYGGKASQELLPVWKMERSSRQLDKNRTEQRIFWTEPTTGLQVRLAGVEYHDFQAVEWTVYFKNTGKENTPMIQDVLGLDLNFERGEGGEFVLHGTKGDWCSCGWQKPHLPRNR